MMISSRVVRLMGRKALRMAGSFGWDVPRGFLRRGPSRYAVAWRERVKGRERFCSCPGHGVQTSWSTDALRTGEEVLRHGQRPAAA